MRERLAQSFRWVRSCARRSAVSDAIRDEAEGNQAWRRACRIRPANSKLPVASSQKPAGAGTAAVVAAVRDSLRAIKAECPGESVVACSRLKIVRSTLVARSAKLAAGSMLLV